MQGSATRNEWGHELNSAIRKAKIEVVGQYDVKNEAQARTAIALLHAYGDSAAGFVYIEPTTARSTRRPPDIVLCHPDIGVLIIEVKGFSIDAIQKIEAGSLFIRYEGWNRPINFFQQARDAMFDIRDAVVRKVYHDRTVPLFNYLASFPNISESEWTSEGFDRAVPSEQLIFKEHLESTRRLKQRVSNLIDETLKESNKSQPITIDQFHVIKEVFGDSAVINEHRPPRSWVDERKLGAYLDEMASLEKYLSKEQEELSRLSIEGHPRLIRGVAGSGKTVVLANLVARFINRRMVQPRPMFDTLVEKPRVAIVCFNRALVPFIQLKIRQSYKQQTFEDVPHDVVEITHLNGLMRTLDIHHHIINYIRISDIPDQAERALQYLKQIRSFAQQNPDWFSSVSYDAIFVDEGQDFVPEEYQVLLELTKTHQATGEKTLVIFYDDAQNLGSTVERVKRVG